MKKFISLMLAFVMVLSLAACGDNDSKIKSRGDGDNKRTDISEPIEGEKKEPVKPSDEDVTEPVDETVDEPTDEPVVVDVTVDSLIQSGYGVDIGVPKSATLLFSFIISEGSRSRTIDCMHEYDGDYDHMIVARQYDEDGTEVPMEYEFYYSYKDSTIYRNSEGDITSGTVERFECPLTKVITVPLDLMMIDPELTDGEDGEYFIKGKCPVDLFNGLLSFVYVDAAEFTEDVDFALIYDTDTKNLVGMVWYAVSGITEYQVVMYVEDVNNTTVTFASSEAE